MAPEFFYVILIFGLFVVPQMLLRFRIPAGITAFALGVVAHLIDPFLVHDSTLTLLGMLGIIALFLFAGLEADFAELQSHRNTLLRGLLLHVLVLALCIWALGKVFQLPIRPAIIASLGLLTPSAGFILDSLAGSSLSEEQSLRVKSKVIALEVLSLTVMFFALGSESLPQLALSVVGMAGMIFMIPLFFRLFAKLISPYAPNSEFAFLLMTAILCGLLTRKLGAYYLVGAFVVGISAQRFRKYLPEKTYENNIHALRVFSSFFIPFYFFKAGMNVRLDDFTIWSLVYALGAALLLIPVRIFVSCLSWPGKNLDRSRYGIAIHLLPTLVFGLVMVGLLRDQYHVRADLSGALMIYTLLVTVAPQWLKRFEKTSTEKTFSQIP